MLRLLVLLAALVNLGLFAWFRAEPLSLQSDREPQRLQRQIAPDAVQVLPDLPLPQRAAPASLGASGSGTGGSVGAATSQASEPESPIDMASGTAADHIVTATVLPATTGASATTVGFASPPPESNPACAEAGPLNDAQAAALRQVLAKAGVPPAAIAERREPAAASWMIYMGRYADTDAWQKKADELRELHVRFERVSAPPSLAPGLSLGSYPSSAEANRQLEALGQHGIHTARVVQAPAASPSHWLQVRSGVADWRKATGTQKFGTCAPLRAATASASTPAAKPAPSPAPVRAPAIEAAASSSA